MEVSRCCFSLRPHAIPIQVLIFVMNLNMHSSLWEPHFSSKSGESGCVLESIYKSEPKVGSCAEVADKQDRLRLARIICWTPALDSLDFGSSLSHRSSLSQHFRSIIGSCFDYSTNFWFRVKFKVISVVLLIKVFLSIKFWIAVKLWFGSSLGHFRSIYRSSFEIGSSFFLHQVLNLGLV